MNDSAFYTVLKAHIGTLRAYPVLAAKNATAPFVVYQRTSTIRDRTQAGESGRSEVSYRIDIYHAQLLEAEAIAEDIATGLLSYHTSPIRYISIESEQDGTDISGDPTLYRWIMEVRVVSAS